eukprot:TRINITY_DN32949_c0_g2_i1.p1 TRINITY_DN32949_c0_g2~~TRINITY_DN32949_c0_g2_i1.p1  ORF type:complete len:475 (-),score=70.12 TRINITY_DN32949_c0_g2_i1:178-1602(-)
MALALDSFGGPVWHASMFFFLYAGMLSDTVFIRASLVMAQSLLLLWAILGYAHWPHFQNGISLPLDQAFWSGMCILVAAIPLFRQLTIRDARVNFKDAGVDKDFLEDEAEAIWRDWYRRSGIPRADFKVILECCDWVQLEPGSRVPMWIGGAGPTDDAFRYGNAFYYVLGGRLECTSHYKEGARNFRVDPGNFIDAFALMLLLGQPSSALAMQCGEMEAHVAKDSTFTRLSTSTTVSFATPQGQDQTLTSPLAVESPTFGDGRTGHPQRGALLMRLDREKILRRVVEQPGLALQSLRLLVTQATMDNLFSSSLDAKSRRRYNAVQAVRMRVNTCPLPAVAASPSMRKRTQWWLAHLRPRDFWYPGPEQRAVNAIRAGNYESNALELLKVHQEELEQLAVLATPSMTPTLSLQSLHEFDSGGVGSPLSGCSPPPRAPSPPWRRLSDPGLRGLAASRVRASSASANSLASQAEEQP